MRFLRGGNEREPIAQKEYKPSHVSKVDWETTMQTATQLVGFVKEVGKRHPPMLGNYEHAIDQWVGEHPGEDLEGLISQAHYESGERQGEVSVIKAKLLLELIPYMGIKTDVHGGPISDLAQIIDFLPLKPENNF